MTGSANRPRRAVTAPIAVAIGLALALAVLGATIPAVASAASPTPSEPAAGDTRSSGEGAGFVGAPFVAVGLGLAVGLLAAGGTLVYVRLTAPKR